jgi:hypothetical protein
MDLKNKTFNKWTVIGPSKAVKSGRDKVWKCRCECGNISHIKTYHLTKGYSKQCVECGHKPKIYTEELDEFLWNRILSNASKRKIKVQISRHDAYQLFLKQDKKCALTDLPLRFANSATDYLKGGTTASLDRINSDKGYETGNLQWVHKDVNKMKNIFDENYFIKLCVLVAQHKVLDTNPKMR